MNTDDKKQSEKKPYSKPKLRVVSLVAEEVLAVGCKVSGGTAGPLGPPGCDTPSPCFDAGS